MSETPEKTLANSQRMLIAKQEELIQVLRENQKLDEQTAGLRRPELCPYRESCNFIFVQNYKNGIKCFGYFECPEEVICKNSGEPFPEVDHIFSCHSKTEGDEITSWNTHAQTRARAHSRLY